MTLRHFEKRKDRKEYCIVAESPNHMASIIAFRRKNGLTQNNQVLYSKWVGIEGDEQGFESNPSVVKYHKVKRDVRRASDNTFTAQSSRPESSKLVSKKYPSDRDRRKTIDTPTIHRPQSHPSAQPSSSSIDIGRGISITLEENGIGCTYGKVGETLPNDLISRVDEYLRIVADAGNDDANLFSARHRNPCRSDTDVCINSITSTASIFKWQDFLSIQSMGVVDLLL